MFDDQKLKLKRIDELKQRYYKDGPFQPNTNEEEGRKSKREELAQNAYSREIPTKKKEIEMVQDKNIK